MRTPTSIAEIYSGLERISPHLSTTAACAVRSVLRSVPPELLRLCLIPLHSGHPVEVHDRSLFAPAARYTASLHEEPEALLWLVFERSSDQEAAPRDAAGEGQMHFADDAAALLEAFHFFAPLTCTPEIGVLDRDLARQLRPVCGADLHGEQLSLHAPVVLGCSEPHTLRLGALAPLDSPPSDYVGYRMAAAPTGLVTFVVLAQNAITLDPDPTVKLTRLR
jgi:hypothetical protein